jgi:hypothetical protein
MSVPYGYGPGVRDDSPKVKLTPEEAALRKVDVAEASYLEAAAKTDRCIHQRNASTSLRDRIVAVDELYFAAQAEQQVINRLSIARRELGIVRAEAGNLLLNGSGGADPDDREK